MKKKIESGEAFDVASRIYGVAGVDMLGLIPNELQTWIGFATGVSAASRQSEAARAGEVHDSGSRAQANRNRAFVE